MWKRVCLHDTTMVAVDSEAIDVMALLVDIVLLNRDTAQMVVPMDEDESGLLRLKKRTFNH